MNPVTIGLILSGIQGLLNSMPALIADYNAIKAAGGATPDQVAALDAQIEALDQTRQASWLSADAALDAASKT